MLKHYVELPKSQHIDAIDKFFGLENSFNQKVLTTQLAKMFKHLN